MVLHLQGITLPDEIERDLYIDGDRIREEPVANAETLAEGVWILPGFVDMHTHPGAEEPGEPFDEEMFERHVQSHRDAGVLTIRCPGLVELLPARLRHIPSPRVLAAGPLARGARRVLRGVGTADGCGGSPSRRPGTGRANGRLVQGCGRLDHDG